MSEEFKFTCKKCGFFWKTAEKTSMGEYKKFLCQKCNKIFTKLIQHTQNRNIDRCKCPECMELSDSVPFKTCPKCQSYEVDSRPTGRIVD